MIRRRHWFPSTSLPIYVTNTIPALIKQCVPTSTSQQYSLGSLGSYKISPLAYHILFWSAVSFFAKAQDSSIIIASHYLFFIPWLTEQPWNIFSTIIRAVVWWGNTVYDVRVVGNNLNLALAREGHHSAFNCLTVRITITSAHSFQTHTFWYCHSLLQGILTTRAYVAGKEL